MVEDLREMFKGWNLAVTGFIAYILALSGLVLAFRGNPELIALLIIATADIGALLICIFVITSKKEVDTLGFASRKQERRFSRSASSAAWLVIIILVIVNILLFLLPVGQQTVQVALLGTSSPTPTHTSTPTPTLTFTPGPTPTATPTTIGQIGTGTTRLFLDYTAPEGKQIRVVLEVYFDSLFVTATPLSNITPISIASSAPIPPVSTTNANASATPPIALLGSDVGAVAMFPKIIAVLECPADGSVLGCSEQSRDVQFDKTKIEPAWVWHLELDPSAAQGKSILVRLYGASLDGERVSDNPLWQSEFVIPSPPISTGPSIDLTIPILVVIPTVTLIATLYLLVTRSVYYMKINTRTHISPIITSDIYHIHIRTHEDEENIQVVYLSNKWYRVKFFDRPDVWLKLDYINKHYPPSLDISLESDSFKHSYRLRYGQTIEANGFLITWGGNPPNLSSSSIPVRPAIGHETPAESSDTKINSTSTDINFDN